MRIDCLSNGTSKSLCTSKNHFLVQAGLGGTNAIAIAAIAHHFVWA